MASVIAEFVITGLYLYYAKNLVILKNIIKYSYKFVLSGILMFFAVRYLGSVLPNNWMYVVVEIGVGAATYIIALIVFRDTFFMDCLEKYVLSYFIKLRNKNQQELDHKKK